MLVREIMTESVITATAETTLRAAIKQMEAESIGSLIVTRDGEPAGILTTTDAMHAGSVTDRSYGDIALREVASTPLVTTGPTESVRAAVTRMRREGVTKLVVVEGIDIVGIVTMTDVVNNYDGIRKEAQDSVSGGDKWNS